MMKTFDLIVEKNTTNVALELTRLNWNGDSPPDIVVLENYGTMLIKIGRYASPGDRYAYRVASVAKMRNGRLMTIPNPDPTEPTPPEAA